MTHNEISGIIIDVSMMIHKKLGPGLLESVYKKVLAYELRKRGLDVIEEHPVPFKWEEGVEMDIGFRVDLFVERKVMVELKSTEKMARVYKKILLTYIRLSSTKLGLLLNFGEEYLKDGICRLVNGLEEN